MDAKVKTSKSIVYKVGRVAVSAAVLSVMLSGCSSVPDAINPVKWYEQTTDFFSGDRQASGVQAEPAQGQGVATNSGLAADPNAPAPARQQVSQVTGGLGSDATSSNYASAPIARQGTARDVLTPADTVAMNTPLAQTSNIPPAPTAQPSVAVTPAFVAPAAAPSAAPATLMAQAPAYTAPPAPSPTSAPKRLSFADAPAAPEFNIPNYGVVSPFGGDQFETIVISGGGMDEMASVQPRRLALAGTSAPAPFATTGAQFPTPGATTTPMASTMAVNMGNMTRVATIHFANNSSSMDARDRSILNAVIQLQKERGGRVVVIGHASSRTRDMDYLRHKMVNFEISMQRAMSIGSALKTRGLGDQNLEVQAVSDSQPLYQEVMPSGEVGNRRVEIYLAAI
ncbi:MAG: OmpA family protein [Candidatus Lindowbacteria bacterium]|nr:OmpA family protein [Candidatus Lindowbacteria bacterium]